MDCWLDKSSNLKSSPWALGICEVFFIFYFFKQKNGFLTFYRPNDEINCENNQFQPQIMTTTIVMIIIVNVTCRGLFMTETLEQKIRFSVTHVVRFV